MILSGLIGGGILYRSDCMKLNIFLLSFKLFSFNIKPLAKYVTKKPKKKKEKKEPAVKEKAPLFDRIKTYYSKAVKYKGQFSLALQDFREIFKIERFSAYVNFGLGNPSLTGKLIGIIYFVNSILPHPYKITQSWDFTKRTLNGELNARITFFSHIFWKKLIVRIPLIISIIRNQKKGKPYSENTLAIQEV
ncbi:hypothetical protein ACFL6H_00680 [Candidatus Latescibacterota bacterium]